MTYVYWQTFKPDKVFANCKNRHERHNMHEFYRCGVCHKYLRIGEQFDLRPIQYERERHGWKDSVSVIVHRGCVS